MTAKTIDEVIERLDAIIEDTRRERSRLGFFAALYRTVTVEVRKGIAAGRFENGPRMEYFDVIFASRYLDALERFRQGQQPSRCWMVAFQAATSRRLLVLQHLLLGMNAHINLDLGIAAARTCPGEELPALKRDFDEINNILSELVDEMQDRIGTVSPWLGFLDRVGGRTDETIVDFSMGKARDAAWRFAERLAPLAPEQQTGEIVKQDGLITTLAHRIRTPRSKLVRLSALLSRLCESNDTPRIIDTLS